ncbi:hypothetical protein McanMca71_003141 [Microsporum canis]
MLFGRVLKRNLFSLRAGLLQVPRTTTSPILQDQVVDEEACPGYKSKSYYPARPGQVVANYQVLVKIGWGTRSTVWLARDIRRFKWQPERYVALKINNCSSRQANHERDIEDHIFKTNPSHRGHVIIRTCLESFEVAGPEGWHLCLAYEPMREPLWLYQGRFPDQKLPIAIAKAYISMLLTGLDYLHSDCKVAHTGKCLNIYSIQEYSAHPYADLKLENILVGFEDKAVVKDFVIAQSSQHMEHKTDSAGRTVYRCHNNFGPLKKLMNLPKIVDFGLARQLVGPNYIETHPIQPDHYRAPEVILGCGWSFSADIWNLGLLVWDIFERKELFSQVRDHRGHYDAKAHMAEMIALLGPPPKALITRYNSMHGIRWPDPIRDEEGNLCSNARELFGGPFFTKDGEFLYTDLIPKRRLEDTLPSLESKERELLLSFVSKMVCWLPEDRSTARELIEHPFLKFQSRAEPAP